MKRLLAYLPLALLGLALCGGGPAEIGSPRIWDIGSSGDIGSGGAAPVDTLEILFCSDLGLNAGATAAGYVAADTSTYDRVIKDINGESYAYWWIQISDSLNVKANGEYAEFRRSLNGTIPNTSHQRYVWLWYDLAKLKDMAAFADGITILDAKLIVSPYTTNSAFDGNDWMAAVLDTLSGDLAALNAGPVAGGDPVTRNVTWQYADSTAQTPWVGLTNNMLTRNDWWDFGIRGDTNMTITWDGTANPKTAAALDVTRPVQMYFDLGLNNAGFVIEAGGDGANINMTTEASVSNPMLVITATTQRHTPPWGAGYALPFVFMTDDGDTCNLGYASRFAAYGWNYSLSIGDKHVGYNATYLDSAQIHNAWLAGNEIVYHSRDHCATDDGDCPSANYGSLNFVPSTEGYDSLVTQSDPSDFVDLIGLPRSAITTFAFPGGNSSVFAETVLDSLGFIGARGTGYGVAVPSGYSTADTTDYLRMAAINPLAIAPMLETDGLFGPVDAAYDSLAILEYFYDKLGTAMENNYAAVIIFTHDTKVSGKYYSTSAPDTLKGLDYGELDDLLSLVAKHGHIRPMTFHQAIVWALNHGATSTAPHGE